MKSKSNQLRKSEEKLQKYLANSGFTTRRNIKNFLAQNTVTKSNKNLKAESLVYDNDCLTISGEDHIVDLNPELEILIYLKDVGQICSNTATDNKETVFSKSNIDREYLCRVYGEVTDSKLSKLLKGIKIQNETSNFSDIVAVKKQGKSKNQWFYVCLFTGKNREVRKLWKSQGLIVNRLIRVRYGSILLPESLKASGWKKLSTKEIKKLKNTYKI